VPGVAGAEVREAIDGCLEGVPTQQRMAFAIGAGHFLGWTQSPVAKFAERNAGQNEQDHAAFAAEIEDGRLEAAELE